MPVRASRSRSTRPSVTGSPLALRLHGRRPYSVTSRYFQLRPHRGRSRGCSSASTRTSWRCATPSVRFCADRFDLDRRGRPRGAAGRPGHVAGARRPGCPRHRSPTRRRSGSVEAAIVFEELGAHLASGPVLWSTLAAPLVDGARRRRARRRRRGRRRASPGRCRGRARRGVRACSSSCARIASSSARDPSWRRATEGDAARPAHPGRRSWPTSPAGEVVGGAEVAGAAAAVGPGARAPRCSSAPPRVPSTSPAATRSSASSSACRSARSRRSSTCSPTCTSGWSWPGPRPTRPRPSPPTRRR